MTDQAKSSGSPNEDRFQEISRRLAILEMRLGNTEQELNLLDSVTVKALTVLKRGN